MRLIPMDFINSTEIKSMKNATYNRKGQQFYRLVEYIILAIT